MDRHISKNPLTLLQPVATMPTAYHEINGFLGSMSATPQDVREQGGGRNAPPLRITKSPDSQNGNLLKIERVQNEGSEC